jgi:hypothetical protein
MSSSLYTKYKNVNCTSLLFFHRILTYMFAIEPEDSTDKTLSINIKELT